MEEDEGLGLGLDRISELPEDILSHIFSLLTMEDYAKTTLVSKTWSSFWSPRPVLVLDYMRFFNKIPDQEEREKRLTQFVKRMAVIHKGHHLQELKFGFDVTVHKMSSPLIRNSIMLASTCNPSTLTLKVIGMQFGYIVDLSMFLCSCVGPSVTLLKLIHGSFVGTNLFMYKGFESVKTLILKTVHLPQGSINHLIKKCPVLEKLHIVECLHPISLHIDATGSKLKLLNLELGYTCRLSKLKINIPSLVKLKFKGSMLESLDVVNLRKVIEAEIYSSLAYDSQFSSNMLRKLLAGINNVNTLTLCTCSLKLKDKVELGPLRCLHHLKEVEIAGFEGDCSQMELVKYLLENALVLERMIIRKPTRKSTVVAWDLSKWGPSSEENQSQEKKAIYEVMAFKRACPDAQVLIL